MVVETAWGRRRLRRSRVVESMDLGVVSSHTRTTVEVLPTTTPIEDDRVAFFPLRLPASSLSSSSSPTETTPATIPIPKKQLNNGNENSSNRKGLEVAVNAEEGALLRLGHAVRLLLFLCRDTTLFAKSTSVLLLGETLNVLGNNQNNKYNNNKVCSRLVHRQCPSSTILLAVVSSSILPSSAIAGSFSSFHNNNNIDDCLPSKEGLDLPSSPSHGIQHQEQRRRQQYEIFVQVVHFLRYFLAHMEIRGDAVRAKKASPLLIGMEPIENPTNYVPPTFVKNFVDESQECLDMSASYIDAHRGDGTMNSSSKEDDNLDNEIGKLPEITEALAKELAAISLSEKILEKRQKLENEATRDDTLLLKPGSTISSLSCAIVSESTDSDDDGLSIFSLGFLDSMIDDESVMSHGGSSNTSLRSLDSPRNSNFFNWILDKSDDTSDSSYEIKPRSIEETKVNNQKHDRSTQFTTEAAEATEAFDLETGNGEKGSKVNNYLGPIGDSISEETKNAINKSFVATRLDARNGKIGDHSNITCQQFARAPPCQAGSLFEISKSNEKSEKLERILKETLKMYTVRGDPQTIENGRVSEKKEKELATPNDKQAEAHQERSSLEQESSYEYNGSVRPGPSVQTLPTDDTSLVPSVSFGLVNSSSKLCGGRKIPLPMRNPRILRMPFPGGICQHVTEKKNPDINFELQAASFSMTTSAPPALMAKGRPGGEILQKRRFNLHFPSNDEPVDETQPGRVTLEDIATHGSYSFRNLKIFEANRARKLEESIDDLLVGEGSSGNYQENAGENRGGLPEHEFKTFHASNLLSESPVGLGGRYTETKFIAMDVGNDEYGFGSSIIIDQWESPSLAAENYGNGRLWKTEDFDAIPKTWSLSPIVSGFSSSSESHVIRSPFESHSSTSSSGVIPREPAATNTHFLENDMGVEVEYFQCHTSTQPVATARVLQPIENSRREEPRVQPHYQNVEPALEHPKLAKFRGMIDNRNAGSDSGMLVEIALEDDWSASYPATILSPSSRSSSTTTTLDDSEAASEQSVTEVDLDSSPEATDTTPKLATLAKMLELANEYGRQAIPWSSIQSKESPAQHDENDTDPSHTQPVQTPGEETKNASQPTEASRLRKQASSLLSPSAICEMKGGDVGIEVVARLAEDCKSKMKPLSLLHSQPSEEQTLERTSTSMSPMRSPANDIPVGRYYPKANQGYHPLRDSRQMHDKRQRVSRNGEEAEKWEEPRPAKRVKTTNETSFAGFLYTAATLHVDWTGSHGEPTVKPRPSSPRGISSRARQKPKSWREAIPLDWKDMHRAYERW